MARRLLALTVLVALSGCNTKAFNEGFCREFKKSFVASCTSTCTQKSGNESRCSELCTAALPEQDMYKNRCLSAAK